MLASDEAKKLRNEYISFRITTPYRDMTINLIESLLKKMRLYPHTLKEEIKNLESLYEQKVRDSATISWT